jgi:glycosyltransferase involved in cell wall biosynthesis
MTPPPNRIRVLYCESNVDGTIGGSHYCLLYLIENLDQTRFEPIVIFYQDHPLVARFRESAETLVLDKPTPFTLGPLRRGFHRRQPILALPLTFVQRSINFAGWVALVRRYVRFLRERNIRIVHLNNSIIRHHDWMAAALTSGTPCIAHERGINRSYSAASRFFSKRMHGVISMSKSIRDFMVAGKVDDTNIHVIYDGINPAKLRREKDADAVRAQLGLSTDRPVIGIVGNVRHWKGQEVVIKAAARLVDRHPTLACLIVGATAPVDQPYEDRLRALVRERGLESNVIFCGYQKFPADFVNVMDVVVHASVEPEPFGMVVLEAMGMRKPLIGSRAGGVPEMVVEGVTGFTFPPGDDETLASRLDELLRDPARARAMGEAGHDRVVRDFSVEKYADEVEAFYDDLLAGRTPVVREPSATTPAAS